MRKNYDVVHLIGRLTEIGALDGAHSGKTLVDHLIGTCEILQAWNEPDSVCIGGLVHSIYGTEVFKPVSIPRERRSEVRAIIGEEAEYLGYLFSGLKRSSLWTNLRKSG